MTLRWTCHRDPLKEAWGRLRQVKVTVRTHLGLTRPSPCFSSARELPVLSIVAAAHKAECQAHYAQRIRVKQGISPLNGRVLSRHLGRREHLDTILRVVARLISSQERALRPAWLPPPPPMPSRRAPPDDRTRLTRG